MRIPIRLPLYLARYCNVFRDETRYRSQNAIFHTLLPLNLHDHQGLLEFLYKILMQTSRVHKLFNIAQKFNSVSRLHQSYR